MTKAHRCTEECIEELEGIVEEIQAERNDLANRVHSLVQILGQVEQRLDYFYDHGLPAKSQSAWTTLHVVRAGLSLSKEEQKSE